MAGPEVGSVHDGYRFKGGDPKQQSSWEQVAPVDVSSQYGNGATQLPNGDIVRYGPRGGLTVLQQGGQDPDGPGKLTEAQGKAVLYGGMMRGAERDYQQARQDGYDPSSIRNQIARAAGVIPFDGDFFGRLIRDDVSDRGNQAELRWAEGNLRQLTGAAATNPEIARVAAINFDRGNDELSDQRYRTRAETYEGTRYAAGPGARVLGDYPDAPGAVEEPAPGALPSYPGVRSAVGNVSGGYDTDPAGRPIAPAAPEGSSPDAPVDIAGMSAQDLLNLQPGQYIRFPPDEQNPNGRIERLSGSPRIGASGEQVAPGVYAEENTPEGAVADRRDDNGLFRRIDAGVRGAADVLSLGFADELAAAGDAAIGRGNGRTFGDRYRNNVAVQRAIDQADVEDVPVTRAAGQIAGGLAPVARGAQAVRGAGRLATAGRSALAGAAFGGAYGLGSGEGNVVERTPNAIVGAGVGGGIGAVAPAASSIISRRVAQPAVNALQSSNRFLGRQVGRAGEALGVHGAERLTERAQPNALQSGISRFAERSPQEVNALRDNVSRFRAEEIEPTFSDAVNDGGRGTLRALATRQTPARQQAREFAANRAEGLQDRVSTQARRTISNDVRSPDQIRTEITERRRTDADRAFGAVRNQVVTPEPQVVEALRAPATRSAIEDAATEAANFGDIETANQLRQLVGDALDNPNGVNITVGMADRISRTLNGRGQAAQRAGNNSQAASLFSLADRLRRTAADQVPDYATALQGYAAESRLIEAADLGEQFMRMEADEFAKAINALSPDERQVARAAARRAAERSAGTQGQAPGTAQRLAGGREQGIRSQALLDNPEPMQRAMRTELEAVRNAQSVNPAQGSQTSMNLQDAGGAAGLALDAVRRPISTAIGAVANRIRSRGFSDSEAEAIVEAAIDPARTDELIQMLTDRMSRSEAKRLARVIRYQVTTSLQSGQSN